MEIDVRLESEKDLKTNVGKVIKFFYDKRRMEAEESGWPLKQVKGKQEAYGITAQAYVQVCQKQNPGRPLLHHTKDTARRIYGRLGNRAGG